MVFGLALVLALIFGLASAALSATGGNFILGKGNSATTPTSLVSTLADAAKSAFIVANKSGGPALDLRVQAGKPPMKVNSSAKVTNLNVDTLDGKDFGGNDTLDGESGTDKCVKDATEKSVKSCP